ncbi:MAG TPA: T9SS type A sorting domain-containing protein [Luteibaculaceae bacterium]|nr:T9SS type A sorting domain-containing protein [Luteibaculaceae bacterium]
MKQFNRLLLALLFCVSALVSSAQGESCSNPLPATPGAYPGNSIAASDTLWYAYTPMSNGFLTVSSCDRSTPTADTRVFLYQGACNNLAAIATSDDDCGVAALITDVPVLAGTTYYIMWVNKSAVSTLNFNFTVDLVPTNMFVSPANDNICNAVVLPTDGSLTAGTNVYATAQGPAEFGLNIPAVANANQAGWVTDNNVKRTVWYQFTAPATGVVDISVSANFDVQSALFAGSCSNIAGLTFLGANDNGNAADYRNYCVTEGQTYFIVVDGFGASAGAFDISVSTIDLVRPFFAMTTVNLNPGNGGALCPGADNFQLNAELLRQLDSMQIADADYVNSLSYVWTNANNQVVGTSSQVAAAPAGTYTVAITDTCGTVFNATVTVTDTIISNLDLSVVETTNPTCVGTASGTVSLARTGGYQYVDGQFANTDSLVYSLRFTSTVNATESQILAANVIQINDLNDLNALAKGTYRIYVEDACSSSDSVTFILVDPASNPIVLDTVLAVNPICPSTATGSIDISAEGGEGLALTYEWALSTDGGLTYGAPFATTQDVENLVEGTYRVVAFDPCNVHPNDTLIFVLTDPTIAALTYTAQQTAPTSFNAADGSISIAVAGGLPNYNAVWTVDGVVNNNYDDQLTLTNLPQGIYNVVITDTCASAGTIDTTFVLLAPVANDLPCQAITITPNDDLTTFHNFNATGTESITVPFSNDEGYEGWADINLNRTVWFKFVAPASGAVAISANHYMGLNSNLNFDAQVAVVAGSDCNGSLSVVAANDNQWDNVPVNDSYLEVFCLTPGTEYYVLVDGYQGIGEQGIFSLNLDVINVDALEIERTITQPNCLAETGSIEVDYVIGGVYRELPSAPEEYLYTYSLSGVASGTFRTDGLGNITEVDGVNASSLFFNPLNAGSYVLTIGDTCGIKVTENITIAPATFTPFNIEFTLTPPYCPGQSNAFIDFAFTGGGTPDNDYSYVIRKGSNTGAIIASGTYNSSFPAVQEFLGAADLYYIIVSDACQNPNIKEFVIDVQDPILTPFGAVAEVTNPSCPSTATGSIQVTLTGGKFVGYTELRNDLNVLIGSGSFDTTVTFNNLAAGDYTIYVIDDCNLYDTTIEFTVVDPTADPIAVASSATNTSVFGGTDGSIAFEVNNDFPDYTVDVFVINSFGGAVIDTIALDLAVEEGVQTTISDLSAAIYRLSIFDACGSMVTADTIVELQVFNPPVNNDVCSATTINVGQTLSGTNVAATTQAGEVLITPPTDEDCDSFEGWCLNNGIDASVWYKFTVPATGTFSVEVASGDFDPQVAVYTAENCNSFGGFTLLAANDDRSIMPANSNAYVEGGCIAPGTLVYVLVDAADNNEGSFDITVSEISTGDLAVTGISTNSTTEASNDGTVDLTVTGGVQPYTFAWSDGATAEDRSGLALGTYSVVVTDKCGTDTTLSFTINYNSVSNDRPCDAIFIPADGLIREFDNTFATVQPGETGIAPINASTDCFGTNNWCNNDGLDGTVWFKFTAPSSNVTVSLCNNAQNEIDPQLAVYSATLCSEFATYTLLGANDDSPTCSFGSELTFTNLTPCQTYFVMVDSDAGTQGKFGIAVIDNNSTLNAGNDTTVVTCQTAGTINLAAALTPGADQNGVFSDDNNTGELSGSTLNVADLAAGTYEFTYTVTSSCGMQVVSADYATITVQVKNCTGINETVANNFAVYPNPNNGQFTVSNALEDVVTYTVFDVTGKVVYQAAHDVKSDDKVQIDLSGYAKGMYTLKANGRSGGVHIQRVVIQ